MSPYSKQQIMNHYTNFLFAEPSFLEGMARLMDMGNTLSVYNSSPSPQDADFWALYSDFAAIGEDMRTIVEEANEPQGQAQQVGTNGDHRR